MSLQLTNSRFKKRLLVYNKSSDQETVGDKINQINLQIEQVNTIRDVLGKLLFTKKPGVFPIDIFLVCLDEPGAEMINFLSYIKKHKPELPLVVLSKSAEKTVLFKKSLKGVASQITETNYINDTLNTLTRRRRRVKANFQ